MDSWSKFHKTFLPNRELFYLNLNIKHISETDYEHSTNVWNTMTFMLKVILQRNMFLFSPRFSFDCCIQNETF